MVERLHVLLVEDDVMVSATLEDLLNETYRTTCTQTAKEARARLQDSHIDLALVDHNLLDGSGESVMALAEKLCIPTIAMSGYPDEIARMDDSARLHLNKPFAPAALFAMIAFVLGRSRQSQQTKTDLGYLTLDNDRTDA